MLKTVLGQFPRGKLVSNPKTNPNPNTNLNQGQFSSGAIVRIPLKTKLFEFSRNANREEMNMKKTTSIRNGFILQ